METNKPVIDLAALLEEVNEMIEEKLILEGNKENWNENFWNCKS